MKNPIVVAICLSLIACASKEVMTDASNAPERSSQAAQSAVDQHKPSSQAVQSAVDRNAPAELTQYKADLQEIASDRFEGRAPGAVGERRFVPWLIEQFQSVGLSPGNEGRFVQPVPMLEINNKQETPLSFTGPDGKAISLEYGKDYVLASKRLDDLIKIDQADMVFVGYGVNQPNAQWNDYADVDVKGKIVVTLINDPGFHTGDETLFNGKAMTYAGRWSYKYEEAARQGALGCLIVHDDAGAAYPWEVVQNGAARPEYDLQAGPEAVPPLQAHGWIRSDVATGLFANVGLSFAELRKQASQRGFKAVSLRTKASAQISHRINRINSQNVVGLIKGTERPDEVIVYTAHWDHLGRNFGLVGDQIFNGAVDNGTGVAALLALARAMKATPPKRSIMFLAVTLEESGLLGSRYYAEHPIFPLKQTVANLNIDAMHLMGPTKDVVVIGMGNSELEDLLKPLVSAQNRDTVPEPTPENGYYFRSDHFNFAKVGVPALYFKSGPNHREKGAEYGAALSAEYTKDRYHKPSDEFDANADYRGVMEDIALLRDLGLRLGNSEQWPQWYEKSEFRAMRDAMMK